MQASTEHIIVSTTVKQELKRRKIFLSKRVGKKVSFDMVLRNILGWQ
jgi:hypothetical protein